MRFKKIVAVTLAGLLVVGTVKIMPLNAASGDSDGASYSTTEGDIISDAVSNDMEVQPAWGSSDKLLTLTNNYALKGSSVQHNFTGDSDDMGEKAGVTQVISPGVAGLSTSDAVKHKQSYILGDQTGDYVSGVPVIESSDGSAFSLSQNFGSSNVVKFTVGDDGFIYANYTSDTPQDDTLIDGDIYVNGEDMSVTNINTYIPRYLDVVNGVAVTNPAFPNDDSIGSGSPTQIEICTDPGSLTGLDSQPWTKSYSGGTADVVRNIPNQNYSAKSSDLYKLLNRTVTDDDMNNYGVLVSYTKADSGSYDVMPVAVVVSTEGYYMTVFTPPDSATTDVGNFSITQGSCKLSANGTDISTLDSSILDVPLTLSFKANYEPPESADSTYASHDKVVGCLFLSNTLAPGNKQDPHTFEFEYDPINGTEDKDCSVSFTIHTQEELNAISNIGVVINIQTALQQTVDPSCIQLDELDATDNYDTISADDVSKPTPDFVIDSVEFTTPKSDVIQNYPTQDSYSLVLPANETTIKAKVYVRNIKKSSFDNYTVTVDGTLSTDNASGGDTTRLGRSVSFGNVNYGLFGLFNGLQRSSYSELDTPDFSKVKDTNNTALYNSSQDTIQRVSTGFGPMKLIDLPARTGYIKAGYFLRIDDGTFNYRADYDVRKDSQDFFHASSLTSAVDARNQQTNINSFQQQVTSKLFSTAFAADFKKSGLGLLRDGSGKVLSTQGESTEDFNLYGDNFKVMNGPQLVTDFVDSSPTLTGAVSSVALNSTENTLTNLKATKDVDTTEVIKKDSNNDITETPMILTFTLPNAVVDRSITINFKTSQIENSKELQEASSDKYNNGATFMMTTSGDTSAAFKSSNNVAIGENSVSWSNTKSEDSFNNNRTYDYNTVNDNDVYSDYKTAVQLQKTYNVFWRYPINRSSTTNITSSSSWRSGRSAGNFVKDSLKTYSEKDDYSVGSYPDYLYKMVRPESASDSATNKAIADGKSDIAWITAENAKRVKLNAADKAWWRGKSRKYKRTHKAPVARPMIPIGVSTFGTQLTSSYYPSDVLSQMNKDSVYMTGYFQTRYTEYYHSIYKMTFDYGDLKFGLGLNELSKDYTNELSAYNKLTNNGTTYSAYLNKELTTTDYYLAAKFYIDMYEADGSYHILPALMQTVPILATYTDGQTIIDTKPGTPTIKKASQLTSSDSCVAQAGLFNIDIDGTAVDDIHQSDMIDAGDIVSK